MLHWYTLKVITGKEALVKQWIANNKGNLAVGDVLVPMTKKYKSKKKRVLTDVVIFPGYAFSQFDLQDNEVVEFTKTIPNVIGILGMNKTGKADDAIVVSDGDIKKMIEYGQSKDASEERNFYVGEVVEVIDGPFLNFSGTIKEISLDTKKIQLIVMFFSRPTVVSVSPDQIRKQK